MKNKEKIEREIEKTLNSVNRFEGNDSLLAKINAEIDEKTLMKPNRFSANKDFVLKIAAIGLVILLNAYTAVSFFRSNDSINQDRENELVSLADEYSLFSDDYDINFIDETN